MLLLKGKKGLIMGVANDRSIAWGIAKKLSEHGAELAFTYLGDSLKKRVVPLAESLKSNFTLSCDVEKKEDVVRTFDNIKKKWRNLDFVVHAIAFSEKINESIAPYSFAFLVSSKPIVNLRLFLFARNIT